MAEFIPYAQKPGWEDVVPKPQEEGRDPLSPIAYTQEYRDAMDTFRALVHADEKSERALQLTEHIIRMNAAHYSVWAYRSSILFAIEADLSKELDLMDELMKEHIKSYQVWQVQHRRNVVTKLNQSEREIPFINRVLAEDSKNYHTWAYRQWVLCHFDLEELWANELAFVDQLLEDDVRNNSAWNHRWFCVFERPDGGKDNVHAEIEYSKEKIRISPSNPSSWNYLRGILNLTKMPYFTLKSFAEEFTVGTAISVPAMEFLADALVAEARSKDGAEKDKSLSEARTIYQSLATELDPVRRRYWEHRLNLGKL
ncbi:protein prenylyltransferase [Atractiella rhizophila]|nr:protein prenylyltransferase [Atractiella rhizophila]